MGTGTQALGGSRKRAGEEKAYILCPSAGAEKSNGAQAHQALAAFQTLGYVRTLLRSLHSASQLPSETDLLIPLQMKKLRLRGIKGCGHRTNKIS